VKYQNGKAKKLLRMQTSTILCTGFHRSATSLVAQMLHAGAFNMGSRLVLPHRSNPDGHFEDAELVELHDAALREQGTNLALIDDIPLANTEELRQRIQRYISARDALSPAGWAAKDPRICLFLPAWAQALGPRGRYVLVIRHWSASLQSMLKRHSRVLAEQHAVDSGQMASLQQHHLLYWKSGQLPPRTYSSSIGASSCLVKPAGTSSTGLAIALSRTRADICIITSGLSIKNFLEFSRP
jgi:hypothetical protein